MVYKEIIYSVEGPVAVITLNRPQTLNAVTYEVHAELAQAIVEADKDSKVRVIVITGAGTGFCSGDDIRVMFGSGEAGGEEERTQGREEMAEHLQGKSLPPDGGAQLLTINKPTIAAVNGAAVGYGIDLALMCDMRVASDRARFGEVFLRVGLVPGESMFLLPRLVGLAKAYELILTTDIIDAKEAERIGLVNKVVPHGELMSATMELATKIANRPPIAVKLAKEGIREGLRLPIKEVMQYHSLAWTLCSETEDHKEGARAFIEKREPVFRGR